MPYYAETATDDHYSIDTLAQFGITTAEANRLTLLSPEERAQELEQQIGSYTLEVIKDDPVSNLYHYWFDSEGNVFTNESRDAKYNLAYQFDANERAGLPKEGTFRMLDVAKFHPDRMVLWYSPPGPAAFDNNPDNTFKDITYEDGQLYVQYFDGKRMNASAIKVTEEEALKQFFPPEYLQAAARLPDVKERIAFFLTNPYVSQDTVDEFLAREYKNEAIYTDKTARKHNVQEVIADLGRTFSGVRTPNFRLSATTLDALNAATVTREDIMQAYLGAIFSHMQQNGLETMSLSGSCGGGEVTADMISGILAGSGGLLQDMPDISDMVSGYSSEFRKYFQRKEKYQFDKEGTCQGCEKSHTQVGKLGPCLVCRHCQAEFDAGRRN